MDPVLDGSLRDLADITLVRPAAIWLGLGSFFVGSILFGDALAGTGAIPHAGPLLMLLGVALVGGGFTMEPTDFEYDPGLTFSGMEWYVITGVSALFVAVSAVLLAGTIV